MVCLLRYSVASPSAHQPFYCMVCVISHLCVTLVVFPVLILCYDLDCRIFYVLRDALHFLLRKPSCDFLRVGSSFPFWWWVFFVKATLPAQDELISTVLDKVNGIDFEGQHNLEASSWVVFNLHKLEFRKSLSDIILCGFEVTLDEIEGHLDDGFIQFLDSLNDFSPAQEFFGLSPFCLIDFSSLRFHDDIF